MFDRLSPNSSGIRSRRARYENQKLIDLHACQKRELQEHLLARRATKLRDALSIASKLMETRMITIYQLGSELLLGKASTRL